MSAVITKCLSRISPDMYLHMIAQVIIAAGCKPPAALPALELLDDRLMAVGLLTDVEAQKASAETV